MSPAAARPPRVLLADDHELVRAGMEAQLRLLGQFEIVRAWCRDTLLRAAATPPGCALALVDLDMPGMNGADGIVALCTAHPTLPVIVVTGSHDVQALSHGWQHCDNVYAVLLKSGRAEALRAAIDGALAGVPPPAALVPPLPPKNDALAVWRRLTPRQHEVALAAARGLSNQQIATALRLSEGTVKNHLKVTFRRLGVSNRTQLALRLQVPASDEG